MRCIKHGCTKHKNPSTQQVECPKCFLDQVVMNLETPTPYVRPGRA